MPIYEYVCGACGFEHETLQKMSDEPLVECPECHKPALKKNISAAGFRLTGGGWYETDFKNKKKPDSTSGGEAKTEAKTETKPEADKTPTVAAKVETAVKSTTADA